MYENALCRVATDFEARMCKIRRVALPVDDNDQQTIYATEHANFERSAGSRKI